MHSNDSDSLLYEVQDGVGLITLNRPKVMNAFSDEMRAEIGRAHV